MLKTNHIYQGHALEVLKTFPDESIDCVVTSPPYWALRDYGTEPQIWDDILECEHEWEAAGKPSTKFGTDKRGHTQDGTSTGKVVTRASTEDMKCRGSSFCIKCGAWFGKLGLEPSFNLYIKHLCDVFDEIQRVLTPHGTVWVVIGDTFYGSGARQKGTGKLSYIPREQIVFEHQFKPTLGKELPTKCLVGIPERFMLEMVERGWIVRNKIIWYKPAALPESVRDRFTIDYENVYLFVKSKRYYFKQQFEPTVDSTLKRIRTFTSPIGGNKYIGRPKDTLADRRFSGKPTVVRGNRNKRCVWKIGSGFFKGAHFAVFPKKLIAGPIDAGCPKMVCTKCGKPKMPIFESKSSGTWPRDGTQVKQTGGSSLDSGASMKDGGFSMRDHPVGVKHTLVGWSACGCGADFRNGIVLDPFLGSGTVGMVAKGMGLDWVGIELKEEYVEMAHKRIDTAQTRLEEFV